MTPPQKPDRWEYTYLGAVIADENQPATMADWMARINGMGTLGWELVGEVSIYDAGRALNMPTVMLKRRLP